MKRLFVIANQLPIEIRKIKNKFHIQAGGEREKSGLTDFYDGFDTRWIGLTGIENY